MARGKLAERKARRFNLQVEGLERLCPVSVLMGGCLAEASQPAYRRRNELIARPLVLRESPPEGAGVEAYRSSVDLGPEPSPVAKVGVATPVPLIPDAPGYDWASVAGVGPGDDT